MKFSTLSFCLVTILFCATALGENLVPQGDFSKSKTGGPEGWQPIVDGEDWMVRRCKVKQEAERTFVRINQNPAGIKFDQPVDSEWGAVELTFESRREGIESGNKPWEVPQVAIDFLDADNQSLLDFKKNIWMPDDSDGWETINKTYEVPQHAVTMRVMINYKAKGGTADFANLAVTAEDASEGGEPQ
ncbi:MAG: hypothetical protein AAF086_00820 [Planctomycetota bacterium]